MALTNIQEKGTKQSISNVEVLFIPFTVFQIGIVYWFVVEIVDMTIPKEEIQNASSK